MMYLVPGLVLVGGQAPSLGLHTYWTGWQVPLPCLGLIIVWVSTPQLAVQSDGVTIGPRTQSLSDTKIQKKPFQKISRIILIQ